LVPSLQILQTLSLYSISDRARQDSISLEMPRPPSLPERRASLCSALPSVASPGLFVGVSAARPRWGSSSLGGRLGRRPSWLCGSTIRLFFPLIGSREPIRHICVLSLAKTFLILYRPVFDGSGTGLNHNSFILFGGGENSMKLPRQSRGLVEILLFYSAAAKIQ